MASALSRASLFARLLSWLLLSQVPAACTTKWITTCTPPLPTVMADKAPPMVPGDAAGDRAYIEDQGVDGALRLALAQVIREKPANAMRRIAQLISPSTFVENVGSNCAVSAEHGQTAMEARPEIDARLGAQLGARADVAAAHTGMVGPSVPGATVRQLCRDRLCPLVHRS